MGLRTRCRLVLFFSFERNPSRFDWHVLFHQPKSVPGLQQPVGTSFGSVPVLQQPVGTSVGSVPVLQQPVGTSFGSVPVTNVQKQGGLGPVPKG